MNSASVVAQTSKLRCSSFLIRCAFKCKITRESSVEITQMLRKNRAKSLQNFRKSGTPRAQKNACNRPACAAHTSQRRREITESELHSDPTKQAFSVGITQILRPTCAKILKNFRKTSARRAHKKLRDSASVVSQTSELRYSSFNIRCAF